MSHDHREAIAEVLGAEFDEWMHRMHGITSSCRHEVEAGAMADALLGSDVLAQIRAEARAEALRPVEAIHRPSTDHGERFNPYCVGCWEAGGEDGAPTWPCPTIQAVTAGRSA